MWSDKEPTFQTLLSQIQSWNSQVMDVRLNNVIIFTPSQINKIPNGFVLYNLYVLLKNNLVGVVNTKNRVK